MGFGTVSGLSRGGAIRQAPGKVVMDMMQPMDYTPRDSRSFVSAGGCAGFRVLFGRGGVPRCRM